MFKELRANLYFFMIDVKHTMTVYFITYTASFILFYFLVLLFTENIKIDFILSMPMYIFMGILGFVSIKESFPFTLKLGSTRSGYVLSSLLFAFFISVTMTVISYLLHQLFKFLLSITETKNISFIHPSQLTSGSANMVNEMGLDILLNLILIAIGFMLGAFFYKYGLAGVLTAILAIVLLFIIPPIHNGFVDFLFTFESHKININYAGVLLITLVCYLISGVVLRRASYI